MAVAIGLIILAIMLFVAAKKGWIHGDTIQLGTNIAGIVALLAAVAVFVFPAATSPDPTPTRITFTPKPPTDDTVVSNPTNAPTNTLQPATSTPTPSSIDTPPTPTNTPQPPTPPPSSIDTLPTPTNTPQPPTRIPTATIDADPTVYDNFNNSTNDGWFNESQWENQTSPPNSAAQSDGVLILTLNSENTDSPVLAARSYNNTKLTEAIFFEANLLLKEAELPLADNSRGPVAITLDSQQWYTECGIVAVPDLSQPLVGCFLGSFVTEYPSINFDTWHTLRIEVNPTTMTFTYFLDGNKIGSYMPPEADNLKNANFTLFVKAWKNVPGTGKVVGYVDDVRIGKLGQ